MSRELGDPKWFDLTSTTDHTEAHDIYETINDTARKAASLACGYIPDAGWAQVLEELRTVTKRVEARDPRRLAALTPREIEERETTVRTLEAIADKFKAIEFDESADFVLDLIGQIKAGEV